MSAFNLIQNESIVTKTTITVPASGAVVEAVSTIETVPYWTRSRRRSGEDFTLYFTFSVKCDFFLHFCVCVCVYSMKLLFWLNPLCLIVIV